MTDLVTDALTLTAGTTTSTTPNPSDPLNITQDFQNIQIASISKEQQASANQAAFPTYFNPPTIPPSALGSSRVVNAIFHGQNKTITLIAVDGAAGKIEVAQEAAPSLYALLLAAEDKSIGTISATTSFRTSDFQQKLYNCYIAYSQTGECPTGCTGCHFALPPGQSFHEIGLAIDFSINDHGSGPLLDKFAAIALPFGWVRTTSIEPWHFEYHGKAAQSGLAITKIGDDLKQVATTSLIIPQKNLAHIALKNVYDKVQKFNRGIDVLNQTRADYFVAQSQNLENLNQSVAQEYSQERTVVAAASTQTITSPAEILKVFQYDFISGLWGDGKSGGIPG